MKIESIADQAEQYIRELIVTGKFKPGQQIKEEEVSQQLGVSRPPVREALKMLEAIGLVIRKPRKGVFVPEMTKKDMREIYDLKATLYEMATALAMNVISDKEILKLESYVQKMEMCVEKDLFNVLRYQDLHKTFHNSIMVIAGNDRLRTFASNLHNQVTLFSYKSLQDKTHLHSSVHYHREIVNAMKKKNKPLACRLMKEHVLNALEILCDMSDQKPETEVYFKSTGASEKPLEGITVLEVGRALAGPLAGMFLADMGAKVIKIEIPRIGDESRYWAPQAKGIGTFFLAVNRNKKSITLNLKSEKGVKIFRDLVKKSDIVIENNRVGMMTRLGIDYENLKRIRPEIIFTSLSGFGQTGPYASLPAYEIIAQAMGGMMDLTGFPDGPPLRTGPGLGDILAANSAVYGTMLALYHREKTGYGQHVDASIFESVISALENVITNYDTLGLVATRMGSRVRTVAPYNSYKAKDGYIVIGVCNDDQWGRLAKAMGFNELNQSQEFKENLSRVDNVDKIDHIVQEWVGRKTVQEVIETLQDSGVPCGTIFSIDQLIKDPQFKEREMSQKVSYDGLGSFKVVGITPKLSLSPGGIYSNPPKLGQHNNELLSRMLSYSDNKIKTLEKEKII